jgi:MinD-like ATPase involved in chromosome partitioning or flagellar assembly
VVTQLLLATEWGELDYLVLDMPPGTGDVHLTAAQLVRMSGAVVVTTPSTLSHVDVLKGIAMYEQLKVWEMRLICIPFNITSAFKYMQFSFEMLNSRPHSSVPLII